MKREKGKKATGIYALENKWGYKLNVNHPKIRDYYERFKNSRGISMTCSDSERKEFEGYMLKYIQSHQIEFS